MTDQEYAEHRKDLLYYLKCLGVFAWKHAEDVCQEVLIVLYERLKDPMAPTLKDTQAWLRSVAWNLLTDLYRRESRSIPLTENPDDRTTLGDFNKSWVGEYFIDTMDPERVYMAREELETVREYIDPREYGPDSPPSDFYRKRLERFRRERREKANGRDHH